MFDFLIVFRVIRLMLKRVVGSYETLIYICESYNSVFCNF